MFTYVHVARCLEFLAIIPSLCYILKINVIAKLTTIRIPVLAFCCFVKQSNDLLAMEISYQFLKMDITFCYSYFYFLFNTVQNKYSKLDIHYYLGCNFEGRKEGNVLFNDTLNTFYLRLYGIRHMVKDHSDSEKGNLLPPQRLLFLINSKGSFICTIPQTG